MNHMTMEQIDPITASASPLPTPSELADMHPLSSEAHATVARTRQEIIDILQGRDSRIIAVVGPCSMDDTMIDGEYSPLNFADRVQEIATQPEVAENVLTIMRCPPVKPRSNLGWRGLEQTSVVTAHEIATEIANREIPLASEIMNPSQFARVVGNLSLGWIGARDNQVTGLRHLLSAYPQLPVLAKNSETGDLRPAVDALMTVESSHDNVEVMLPDGRMGVVARSKGNLNTGLLWRAGEDYNSYGAYEKGIIATSEDDHPFGVDMSHGGAMAHDPGNKKSVEGQIACFDHVIRMMLDRALVKQPQLIMIEAYLQDGNDVSGNTPGMSLTDPCVSVDRLDQMMQTLSQTQAALR